MILRTCKPLKNNSFFLFGARQTGKSTLVQSLFESTETHTYNLLDTKEYIRLTEAPHLFKEEVESLPSRIKNIFIDEVQLIPLLLNEVHLLIEKGKKKETPQRNFILTGSSARKLKRAKANLLGGRALTYNLFPLTASEIGTDFNLQRALRYGTLPGIYLEEDSVLRENFLRSYVETYLKEEIEDEALIRNSGKFFRFLTIAADCSGKIINYSTIAKVCGVASPTVKEYFAILEDTLIGRMLPAFDLSKRKVSGGHPKFYLFDTGVQRAILKHLSAEVVPSTYLYGNLFEQWLVNETFRTVSYLKPDIEVFYYRGERDTEIDLIISTPLGKRYGIEIKSSEKPDSKDISSAFNTFTKKVKLDGKFLVCNAPLPRKIEDVEVLPWKHYLDWLAQL